MERNLFKPIGSKKRQPGAHGARRTAIDSMRDQEKRVEGGRVTPPDRESPKELHIGYAPRSKKPNSKQRINITDLKSHAATLEDRFYRQLIDCIKPSREQVTAWGVATEKCILLSGRPTEIIAHTEVEKQRPSMIRLAERIAMNRKKESA